MPPLAPRAGSACRPARRSTSASLLQSYIWQDYDLPPDYPALQRFLAFWEENLDGPLHSVRLAHSRKLAPARWRNRRVELRLH